MLVLPGRAARADRNEREALRKELDEARKQGEVYARELAAVFDRGEEVATVSSVPPAPGPARRRSLRHDHEGLRRRRVRAPRHARPAHEGARLAAPSRRDRRAARHAAPPPQPRAGARREPAQHRQPACARARHRGRSRRDRARRAARDGNVFGERNEVKVVVKAAEGQRLYVRCGAKAVAALARELVAHAVAASPRARSSRSRSPSDPDGPRLVVDDAGSPLPASGRRAFLALETHAGQYARPSGLPIFMAAELAACIGARLELSDAPARRERRGERRRGRWPARRRHVRQA